jgi:hypothetical protein
MSGIQHTGEMKLRGRLMAVIVEHESADGTLGMAFPLRLLSVRTA